MLASETETCSIKTMGGSRDSRNKNWLCRFGFSWPVYSAGRRFGAGPDPAWFRTGIGLDDSTAKPRIAVPDFVPREDASHPHATLFAAVVRDDLTFSGIIDVASPSFYPQQVPSVPGELKPATWTDQPLNANMVAFGNLRQSASEVAIQAWLNDVRNPSGQPIIGKVYRGSPTDADVRRFAHQFADEIISKLSGGIPGIASTQIAFVSSRNCNKKSGDGLRRPKPAPTHLAQVDLAHSALVAG